MYQNHLKECNCDHKFLRCTDLLGKNFEVLRSEIALDEVYLECAVTVKAKPNGNYSGFITYSKRIKFSIKWLDKSGYLITQLANMVK